MNFWEKLKDKTGNIKRAIVIKTLEFASWLMDLSKKKRIILGGGSGAVLLSLLALLVILSMPKVYAIQVEGDMVGYIGSEGELDTLIEEVKTDLSKKTGSAKVIITEKDISLEKAKNVKAKEVDTISKKELEEAVISKKVCKADSCAISVDGKYVVSAPSKECGEKVLAEIKNEYKEKAKGKKAKVKIVQDVEFNKAYSDVENVLCEKELYQFLTSGDKESPIYKVEAGESVKDIAKKKNVKVKKIKELNPDLKKEAKNKPLEKGTKVKTYKPEPVVDVQTKEVVESEKSIKPKTEYKETSSLPKGEKKVEFKGKKGRKEVTEEVVKINGKKVESKELDSKVIEEAEDKVVLVGTAETSSTAYNTGTYASSGSGTLGKPMSSLKISSPYGPRGGGFHSGTDFWNPKGTPIYASESGQVVFASYSGSYGNVVKISHGNGLLTLYSHCDAMLVSPGQTVSKGQQIATVGMTGRATGYHLHFEVQINGNHTNPMAYL